MLRNKICMWILNVIIVIFCIAGCGKNPSDEVSFVLPDADMEFQKTVEEETTEEETTEEETTQEETTIERVINIPHKEEIELLIEKYNEAERLFSGELSQRDYYNTIYTGEHKGSYRLKYLEYNTLAGMDTYWRQYFSQTVYDERFGASRKNAFFEYDGDLCMQAVSGFVDKIIFESVSDWVETDNGIEACFDFKKNRCSEFINGTEHFDRVRITFVWEDDTLKIGKILDLETHE